MTEKNDDQRSVFRRVFPSKNALQVKRITRLLFHFPSVFKWMLSQCKIAFDFESCRSFAFSAHSGGILNLIGATRGKLCEKGRPVRGRLSLNSFIPPRHIRKYVQWPPRRICLQEPLWSLVRPDPVDRLFSELAGRALRAHRCFHRFRPEHREFQTVFLQESFCLTLSFWGGLSTAPR